MTGLLLINLGTPDTPSVPDVRRYLRQFLWDARVLDIPAWRRWLVLNLFILPFRPAKTAHAYRAIWTPQGSPLLVHTQNLANKVQALLGDQVSVEIAMRYGQPSIASALEQLRKKNVQRIVVFPLYPQYAAATTGSSIEEFFAHANRRWNTPYVQIVPAFYDHPAFVAAFAAQARTTFDATHVDRVLFSYHGLPERHVQKSDATYDAVSGECEHCLMRTDCCETIDNANRHCYRAQCFATTRALSDALNIPATKRVICFQSRLGRTPWIKPYTDHVLEELVKQGVKNIALFSPAFVADCLETVEELGIRARADWKRMGGNEFHLVPCPNDSDLWARGIVAIARQNNWLAE